MIDIKIPFRADGNIGKAYLEAVKSSYKDWVLILDHDVMILHPNWYHICCNAILKYPDAGLFTCWTNRIKSKVQLATSAPPITASLLEHRKFAKQVWDVHVDKCTKLDQPNQRVSGFFFLVKKEAFLRVGCCNGFFGVDWDLTTRIRNLKYGIYRIDGIYCFHLRDREPSWIPDVKVSRSFLGAK